MTRDAERARPRFLALEPLAVALLLLAVATSWGHLLDWRAELGRFQRLGLLGFAAYALAVARRHHWRAMPRAGAFVMLIALALRVAVLPVTPTLSDDVHRYAWEGKVLAHGMNPWRYAPDAPELAPLRDEVQAQVNHPSLRAIYPPLAELGFALVARISYTLIAFKLWVILHDLALCAVLAWWCARRGGSAWDALVYAWNPLVIAEYAGSAHHDPTAILWCVVALAWLERRPLMAAGSMLAAVMVKWAALLAWPFVLRDQPSPRLRLGAMLALLLALAGYVALTHGQDSGLEAFVMTWRHNDALFGPVAALLGESRARLLVSAALAGLTLALLLRRVETVAATRLLFRAGLLLSPVVHPWYLGWVLALEPLSPSWPWLVLSCTVGLAYGVGAPPIEAGAFHPSAWTRAFEYGLPALVAILLWLVDLRRRNRVRDVA